MNTPTARQSQFIAYIYRYSLGNGFTRRVPGQARSITLLIPPESMPNLKRTLP